MWSISQSSDSSSPHIAHLKPCLEATFFYVNGVTRLRFVGAPAAVLRSAATGGAGCRYSSSSSTPQPSVPLNASTLDSNASRVDRAITLCGAYREQRIIAKSSASRYQPSIFNY